MRDCDPVALQKSVYESKLLNFKGQFGLLWIYVCGNNHYKVMIVFLIYGWPVGYVKEDLPVTVSKNYKICIKISVHVDEYMKELSYRAIIDIPISIFSFVVSPPKKTVLKGEL